MSSSFWIVHHFGGLQLCQQRILAWCLVEASPRFSVRIPTSSKSPINFPYAMLHNARTRLLHYNRLAYIPSCLNLRANSDYFPIQH